MPAPVTLCTSTLTSSAVIQNYVDSRTFIVTIRITTVLFSGADSI